MIDILLYVWIGASSIVFIFVLCRLWHTRLEYDDIANIQARLRRQQEAIKRARLH